MTCISIFTVKLRSSAHIVFKANQKLIKYHRLRSGLELQLDPLYQFLATTEFSDRLPNRSSIIHLSRKSFHVKGPDTKGTNSEITRWANSVHFSCRNSSNILSGLIRPWGSPSSSSCFCRHKKIHPKTIRFHCFHHNYFRYEYQNHFFVRQQLLKQLVQSLDISLNLSLL